MQIPLLSAKYTDVVHALEYCASYIHEVVPRWVKHDFESTVNVLQFLFRVEEESVNHFALESHHDQLVFDEGSLVLARNVIQKVLTL